MNALFMKVFSRDTILSLGNIHEIELYVASLNEDMHHHLLALPGDLDLQESTFSMLVVRLVQFNSSINFMVK